MAKEDEEGIDLALVLGGESGAKKTPKPKAAPVEEEGDDEGLPPDFDTAADEFLDDTLPVEERKAALKRAILACKAHEEEGGY